MKQVVHRRRVGKCSAADIVEVARSPLGTTLRSIAANAPLAPDVRHAPSSAPGLGLGLAPEGDGSCLAFELVALVERAGPVEPGEPAEPAELLERFPAPFSWPLPLS